jgi:hypothetical protein
MLVNVVILSTTGTGFLKSTNYFMLFYFCFYNFIQLVSVDLQNFFQILKISLRWSQVNSVAVSINQIQLIRKNWWWSFDQEKKLNILTNF